MKHIPRDAYTFVDYYGDGFDRLKNLLEENGYFVVADIYTYGMPISLWEFADYGWTTLDETSKKYDAVHGLHFVQLPVPKPLEELGI